MDNNKININNKLLMFDLESQIAGAAKGGGGGGQGQGYYSSGVTAARADGSEGGQALAGSENEFIRATAAYPSGVDSAFPGGNGTGDAAPNYYTPIVAGAGGGAGGEAGVAGTDFIYDPPVHADDGGQGGFPGGGGGGGGAGDINGFFTAFAGNGGNGGAGLVLVEWW